MAACLWSIAFSNSGNSTEIKNPPCAAKFAELMKNGDAAELEAIYRNAVKRGAIEEDARINLDGQFKTMARKWEIRFPQDQGKYSEVLVFGSPHVGADKQTYVDFAIWSRPERGAATDINNHHLRRMPLEAFEAVAMPEFRKLSVKPGQLLVLPITNKKPGANGPVEVYRVKSVSGSEKEQVQLVSTTGTVRTSTVRELFRSNLAVDPEELEVVNRLFSIGLTGDIIHADSLADKYVSGLIIRVRDLPKTPVSNQDFLPLSDLDTLNELHQLQARKVPIMVANAYNGFDAQAISPGSVTNINKLFKTRTQAPGIFITARTNLYVLKHEGQHVDDFWAEGGRPWNELLEMLKRKELSSSQVRSLDGFLLEQRAYSREVEALTRDLFRKKDSQISKFSLLGPQQEPFEQFAKDEVSVIERQMGELYVEPVKKALDEIRSTDLETYRRVSRILRSHALQVQRFTLEDLLPTHFSIVSPVE